MSAPRLLHFKKLRFYAGNLLRLLGPCILDKRIFEPAIQSSRGWDPNQIKERVNYYCKVNHKFRLKSDSRTFDSLSIWKEPSIPCLDLKRWLRYFPRHMRFDCNLHDNVRQRMWIPQVPSFVKCRPIEGDNSNSVLLKLNSVRFFDFKKDRLKFAEKKPIAVFRGPCHREHRQQFVEKCYSIPSTDIGDTRKRQKGQPTHKGFLSQEEQLHNKFIISVEGNDVSSSLMWIMASNSLAFMTKHNFEGWFMQGRLIPNYHYVLLRDDYSDLSEKIDFYTRNIDQAMFILNNAKKHVAQFFDLKLEKLVSILVVLKYFELSEQISGENSLGV